VPTPRLRRFVLSYGNVTTVTSPPQPDGPVVTSLEYTPFDPVTFSPPIRVKKITDPLGHPTEFLYDTKGNVRTIRKTHNTGTAVESYDTIIDYNAAGQPTSITDPEQNITKVSPAPVCTLGKLGKSDTL